MSHPRAKLTVAGRRLLIERVRELGWSVPMAAEAQGCSAHGLQVDPPVHLRRPWRPPRSLQPSAPEPGSCERPPRGGDPREAAGDV
jgi:hypothetical protein